MPGSEVSSLVVRWLLPMCVALAGGGAVLLLVSHYYWWTVVPVLVLG